MPDIQDLHYREMPTIQVSSCGKSGCKDKAVASAEEEQVSYHIFQKIVLKSMGFKYGKSNMAGIHVYQLNAICVC